MGYPQRNLEWTALLASYLHSENIPYLCPYIEVEIHRRKRWISPVSGSLGASNSLFLCVYGREMGRFPFEKRWFLHGFSELIRRNTLGINRRGPNARKNGCFVCELSPSRSLLLVQLHASREGEIWYFVPDGTGTKKPRGERGRCIEGGIVFGDQQAGASASCCPSNSSSAMR